MRYAEFATDDLIYAMTHYGRLVPLGPSHLAEAHGGKLGRVWQHMQNTPFIIMSAFRHERTYEQNLSATASMIRALRQYGLGGLQMEGHWIEVNTNAEPVPVKEISFMVPLNKNAKNPDQTPMGPHDLLNVAIDLGKRFEQDAVLFGDQKHVYEYSVADPNHATRIADTKTLNQPDLSSVYTKVKNKNFAFGQQPVTEQRVYTIDGIRWPTSHVRAVTMQAMGIWV